MTEILLLQAKECPQLGAEYILIQPEVVAQNPRRGWRPIGGRHGYACDIGTDVSPEMDLGDDVDPDHTRIAIIEGEGVFISDGSVAGTDVRAHPEDVLRLS